MNPKLLGSLLVGIIVLTGVYIGTLSLDQQQVAETILDSQQAQVSAVLPSGLIAHLPFDDSSASDVSGKGNNGSWVGSSSFSAGKIGNGAATFGGSNYVVIDDQVYSISAGTVAFWFKKGTGGNLTGSYGGIQNQRAPTLSVSPTTGTLRWEYGGSTGVDTGISIDSNWHHVAMTYTSSGTVRIYLDGSRVVNTTAASNPEEFFDQVHIGHYGNFGSSFGNNTVDDFRIYNKALSASEVSSLYAYTGVTTPSDTVGPVISNVSVSDIQTNEVTITWDTNELSDTQLEFGLSTGYGNSSSLKDTGASMVTSHRQIVVGVQPNTIYNYRVKSRDAAGNLTTSSNYTFTTASVADTSVPSVPSNLQASSVTQTGVNLSWTASTDNVGVTSYDIYRNGVKIDSVAGTSDSDSGLTTNTTYSYTVLAVDAAGNKSAQSTAKSVTTLAPAPAVTLSAAPTTIFAGQSTTLTWSSTNATSCSGVGGGFTGTQPLSGSKAFTLQSNTTYSIACTGTGGSKDAVVYITVNPAPEVRSDSFKAGDIVRAKVAANVRATGALTGTLLGTQAVGSYATVVGGGVQNSVDKFFWWNLNFITGADGYVGEDGVELAPVSTAFKAGDRVQTLNSTNVRSSPVISAATLLGSQPTNAIGTIVGGGMLDSSGTFSWWNINYDSGVDGYSGGDNLKLYSAATTFTVMTAKAGNGSGTVACNPSTCTANIGSSVTLTATPATGSTFTGWSGGCTGTGSCSRTSAGTVTATFTSIVTPPTTFTVATAKLGTGSGTVSCDPSSCSATQGTTVLVSATAASGSTLAGVTVSPTSAGSCTVNSCALTSAGTVTATFNVVPVTGNGGNWYLNANVSTSGNGTSWSNAWKNTGNIVWSSIQPGDTIWVAGGSYGSLLVGKSGTAASPINIKRVLSSDAIPTSAAGWSSSLDARATFTGSDALSTPVSYVLIDGRVDMGLRFVLTDTTAGGLPSSYNATGGNYITLNSVDLVGPNAVARPDGSSISNPLVNHAGDTSGVKIGYGYSPNPGADNITIKNSRVRGHANEFWFAGARKITIENNKIYDNGAANSAQWHGNMMIVNGSDGIIFRNNDVYNWQVEGLYPWGSTSKNWYVYGNVFHDGIGGKNGSSHRFLELRSYSGTVTHGPFYVYNNTVANAYAAFTRGDTSVYWSADSVARNNLVYNVAGAGVGYLPAQASNNLYYSTSPFVSANDYRLSAGIAGVSVPNVTTVLGPVTNFQIDPDGKTRGADGVWDIGAYEYSGTTQPPVNVPPTVTLISSPSSAVTPGTFSLSASASDSDGTVSKVEFYNGSTLLSTDTSSPYTASFVQSVVGTYTLTARAYDNAGAMTTSNSALASVTAAPIPNSTKFIAGDRVATTDILSVRSSGSTGATSLGTQALGNLGTVVGGGTSADGYYWWNVNYDTGVDGWSVENYLVKYTAPTTVTATVVKVGTGSGTVTCNPSSCSSATGSVTLTASATSGSTFAGWSGACSGTGSCTITSSASVTATFNIIPIVSGTTFYVSPSGSGAKNGTSPDNAYAGIPTSLVAGATYYVAPGSYPKLTVTSSGTAVAPITIRRSLELAPNELVASADMVTFASGSVISGSNVIIDGKGWHGFNFSSGATVAMNGGAVTVLLSGSNVTLKNGFFNGNYGSGYASLGVIPPATGVTTVSYSDFYQSSYEDQLNISASVGGGDVVFDHNVFRDNNKPNRSDTSHRDVSNPWTGTGGWGLTLSNNIFFNTPGHASDQPQGDEFLLQIGYGGSATPLKKVIAFNNVVHNTARFIAFGSQNSGVNEFKVYNNTLRNTTYASSLGITTTAPAIAPTTANNIAGSVTGGFVNSNPTSIQAMYGADGKPFTSDDAFALTSGSTVIDKGTGSLISPVDITGRTRTGTADFGAYEFSGIVTTPNIFTVATAKLGTGSGTVSCDPSSCSTAAGSTVLVSATAASGSTLASVTVSPPSAGSCTVNSCALTAAGTVTATFNVIPVTGTGNNWYLNASVGTSGNGSSWSNAWKNTGNIVWSSIQPGDTIWVAGGSYGSLLVGKSGTAASPINIKRVLSSDAIPTSAAGWSSSLDARATFTGSDALSTPVSYVLIDGRVDMGLRFVLTDTTAGGLPSSYNATGGNYITLNSVDLVGPNAVARPDGSSISNPLVNHAGDTSGVKIGYGYSPNPGADNITIKNSRVRGHANEFWFAGARKITIENNKIYDNGAANSAQWHGNMMIVNGSDGIIFRNNDVYNWQVEGLYPWGSTSKNWYVYGNVFHDGIGGKNGSSHRFLELRSYSGTVTHGPFYVYNNTVANAYAAFTRGDTSVYWSADSVARNNLVYNVAGAGVGYLPAQASNNLYYSTSPFVSANDYRLSAGIAGVSVPNVTTVLGPVTNFQIDPDGKTRGADGVWDIGAYEF